MAGLIMNYSIVVMVKSWSVWPLSVYPASRKPCGLHLDSGSKVRMAALLPLMRNAVNGN